MKKLFFLFTLFFLPFYVFSSRTSFTFSRVKATRNLFLNVSTNKFRYSATLNQNEDGQFKLSVPPSFNYHTDSGWVAGELRLGGLFAFSMNPCDKDILVSIKQQGIKDVFTPSLKPEYSGIAKKFGNATVAVTNPLFNRESPLGVMVEYKTDNLFLSAVKLNKSRKQNDGVKIKYQINWKDINLYDGQYYLLIGANSDLNMGLLKIRTAGFSDTVFDTKLGFWGYYACEVKADIGSYSATVNTGYNSSGSDKEAQQLFNIGFKIDREVELSVSYKNELFPLPIYGGTSQKNIITFQNELRYSSFRFRAKHTYTVEETTGHTCVSVYSLSAGSFVMDKNFFSVKSEITIGREDTVDTYIKKFYLVVQDRFSRLEFAGKKTYLTLSLETYVKRVKVKASVTQDRVFTISASVNY